MGAQADAEGVVTIGMPRIGAGYGGLSWNKVRAIIDRVFVGWPRTLYVYEAYMPQEAADDTSST